MDRGAGEDHKLAKKKEEEEKQEEQIKKKKKKKSEWIRERSIFAVLFAKFEPLKGTNQSFPFRCGPLQAGICEYLRSALGGKNTRKLIVKMPYISSTVYCFWSARFFYLLEAILATYAFLGFLI